jgi:hypothetical protein
VLRAVFQCNAPRASECEWLVRSGERLILATFARVGEPLQGFNG